MPLKCIFCETGETIANHVLSPGGRLNFLVAPPEAVKRRYQGQQQGEHGTAQSGIHACKNRIGSIGQRFGTGIFKAVAADLRADRVCTNQFILVRTDLIQTAGNFQSPAIIALQSFRPYLVPAGVEFFPPFDCPAAIVIAADDDAEGKVYIVRRTAVLLLQRRQQVKRRQPDQCGRGQPPDKKPYNPQYQSESMRHFTPSFFFRRPHRN